jgi:hypothetical protein|tara:strand:+ start:1755 stop:2735 length:981 start_codon:yes stop_codon:yes gene_type:complete
MIKIVAHKDLGRKETFEGWNGKFLDETAYDKVLHVTEDIGIMKPIHSLDGSDVPLAYVITNAFPKESKIREILTTIEDTSTMRANCAGPISAEEMAAKGLVEGKDYKLRTPNSYHVRTKSGGWGMIAYSREIHSVMIGHKRGRFTGGIDVSGWCKDNPEKWEALQEISTHNETAFAKANEDIYKSQKSFAHNNIKPEHRIGDGIFTTLSANRYSAYQSAKMSAHVDSGDTDAGMTSMCVFREGDYEGAYLTFPRYGIAIDAPDNSVIIADSQEVHGVTPISGTGQRFSCVAYCDRRLATIGVYGKQEKLIGKYAAKNSGNLESFFE